MVASIKYFITDSGGSWIDWSLNISPLTVLGKEAQVVGGAGGDSVYVQAGSSHHCYSAVWVVVAILCM